MQLSSGNGGASPGNALATLNGSLVLGMEGLVLGIRLKHACLGQNFPPLLKKSIESQLSCPFWQRLLGNN